MRRASLLATVIVAGSSCLTPKEAGSLSQDAVIQALDHAKIAAGPGGPAEMVPGQHHARLNMYIAQASNGIFRVVKNLGVVEPNERTAGGRHAAV